MKYIYISIAFLLVGSAYAINQDSLMRRELKLNALRSDEQIIIDGKLSENIWKRSTSVPEFIQRDPHEGLTATEKTEVIIAYDDNALYIAARLHDSSPDSIIARLARKDDYVKSDRFLVFLDPYHDKRSGYFFTLNAAGSLSDGVLFNDDWDDDSWDGIWEGKAAIDENGWTAEIKIPFSQLRFELKEENIWGINLIREIARKNERDCLVFIPKNESGFVSRFAELYGVQKINPPGNVEVLPYINARGEFIPPIDNDPFNDGSEYFTSYGADLKVGLGSNLTLNATINPDFGQVEIDPAVINLSDVETFYQEKRPFFIEGSNIFNFGVGGANNYWGFNWGSPDFFYSRRIGRAPQGSLPDADFVNYPDGTHILGAAKLTGKIGESWNIGTIQAVTRREFVDFKLDNFTSEAEIEPLTYYGVIRGQKEFNSGDAGLGFISTSTSRFFEDPVLKDQLNKNAFTGGFDGWIFLDSSNTWVLTGWLGLSHIIGTSQRIISVQRNPLHYFQRPDSKNLSIDSTANSLTGFAGRFYLNKQKGNFFFNSAFGFLSPKFDLNDIGFQWRSDLINAHIGGGYRWTEPTDFYQFLQLGGAVYRSYNFDGMITGNGIFHFGFFQFLDYSSLNWNLSYNSEVVNTRRTRGGPITLTPSGYQADVFYNSDERKEIVFNTGIYTYQSKFSRTVGLEAGFELHPLSNISFSIMPAIEKNFESTQWVGSYKDILAENTFGRRYVFAELRQTTLSANIRLNWTFTPTLSLQLYVQPLISSGDYSNYKELKRPGSYEYLVYGFDGSTFDDEKFIADPDGNGPAPEIEIGNRDFNFKSLRGNAVLRWEYVPGSVLYFVWTQNRADFEDNGEFQVNRSLSRLWDTAPENIFMVKLTYWFNL
ncbi:MAG: carbohydrate binding family 9 domain-containing protein [Ignavibacteriaceae bacterium]|nr:carbohydrate binding family 9 domain-containing protein [Ignavibacteriaceae bacterium]